MGRRKATGSAQESTEPTRKSRRLRERGQLVSAEPKKKTPPKPKKVKEVVEPKTEEPKGKPNEETPSENGDTKAEEEATADETV